MFDFSDRVAIVTGIGGNLGTAVAQALVNTGAKLALVGRDADSIRSVFPEVDREPARFLAAPADLTDPAAVERMTAQVMTHFGQIDILANTVGGYVGGMTVQDTSVENWEKMLLLNARTAFLISQTVIPHMLERESGKIVHTAARAGLSGSAKMAAYSASKGALIRLVEALAAEVRHSNINVNCVLPGTIDTPQNRQAMPNANFSQWVSPEAIADVILFLASDLARAINGAAIPVFGRS
jgi:NAD(P)-dependent dehydrogenase (short-subunit alcohol dehydrogenase family)